MAFNIDNFNVFQETAGEFTDGLDSNLSALATRIADDMRQRVPTRSGELKRSIKINIDRYDFILEMLYYGPFQNYGVSGTNSGKVKQPFNTEDSNYTGEVKPPFGIDNPFEDGNFQFRNREFGIPSRQFYDVKDILEQMVQEILEIEI